MLFKQRTADAICCFVFVVCGIIMPAMKRPAASTKQVPAKKEAKVEKLDGVSADAPDTTVYVMCC